MAVVVVGAGGHGRVLIDALLSCGTPILGLCDPGLDPASPGPFGLPVLGGDDVLPSLSRSEIQLVNGIGSVRNLSARAGLFERLKAGGFSFASVIHPSAIVSRSARLGEGVQIMAGTVVQCDSVIGDNSILNTRSAVDHDCRIGHSVHIAPGCTLSGGVTVGDHSHIGTGAVIIQGITIGQSCLIAAGTTVYRSLPDHHHAHSESRTLIKGKT